MLKVVGANIRRLTLFCIRSTRLILLNIHRKRLNTKAALMAIAIGGALLVLILSSVTPTEQTAVWGYRCESRLCIKERMTAGDSSLTSLSVCKQQCGDQGNLWPQPNGLKKIGTQLTAIDVWSIALRGDRIDPSAFNIIFNDAFELFRSKQRSKARNPDGSALYESSGKRLIVVLDPVNPNAVSLDLATDESYELKIDTIEDGSIQAKITANNFYGTRHGLETLHQLILVDDLRKEIRVPSSGYITDKPSYPYRGILLDTSRSFITIDALKRTVDAMGASKLNTLHWHITDSHSFPFESKSYPELTRLGAYSEKHVYSEKEIVELVEYARARGVRVVPELDAPAHVGEGWEFAPGTVVCFKANPWRDFCVEPPCGQLDPTNEQVYDILGGIYKDMIRSFNPTVFHMGGDEVNFRCWNTSQTIQQWFNARNLSNSTEDSFHDLWDHFQTKALDKLVSANGGQKLPVVIWTSSLTGAGMVDKYLDPNKYIIQIWTKGDDTLIRELAYKKYKLIFSNYDALYFDCGYGAWVGTGNNWCSPYIGWQKVYDNDPRTLLRSLGVTDPESLSLALGAEAALWTEQADSSSIDSKIWPRAAAMAERLWSDPASNWQAAESRFLEHRERLVNLGVSADSIEPQWCVLNQGYCY